MKKEKKKDWGYIPILDKPEEELKKPMGEKVNFGDVMTQILAYKPPKKKQRRKK